MLNTELYPVEIASACAATISETKVDDPGVEEAEAAITANELPRGGKKRKESAQQSIQGA